MQYQILCDRGVKKSDRSNRNERLAKKVFRDANGLLYFQFISRLSPSSKLLNLSCIQLFPQLNRHFCTQIVNY